MSGEHCSGFYHTTATQDTMQTKNVRVFTTNDHGIRLSKI